MGKYLAVLFISFILCSCASNQNTPQSELGEWNFAYIQKGPFGFAPPPQFDTYIFNSLGKITIKSSLEGFEFDGIYRIFGNILTYEFNPPDVEKPIEHKLKYILKNKGNILQLTLNDTELIYYRPEYFFPNNISGEYKIEKDGKCLTMKLGSEGEYLLKEPNVIGHYRLWPSRYGKTMSATVWIPHEGGFFMLWKYEVVNKDLKLTQIAPDGPNKATETLWKNASN